MKNWDVFLFDKFNFSLLIFFWVPLTALNVTAMYVSAWGTVPVYTRECPSVPTEDLRDAKMSRFRNLSRLEQTLTKKLKMFLLFPPIVRTLTQTCRTLVILYRLVRPCASRNIWLIRQSLVGKDRKMQVGWNTSLFRIWRRIENCSVCFSTVRNEYRYTSKTCFSLINDLCGLTTKVRWATKQWNQFSLRKWIWPCHVWIFIIKSKRITHFWNVFIVVTNTNGFKNRS